STTAEKATMLHFLDGRVSAVIGTHTKVMSADERVTEKGTAYISDNGRVGSFMSVGGFDTGTEIAKYRTQIPARSKEAWDDPRIQGVVVEIDEETGKSTGIIVIDEKVSVQKPQENAR
ncbi:MAG: YmdB family metallophosphoesterase, partial [Candidatus Ornithospirochaeta sp.]